MATIQHLIDNTLKKQPYTKPFKFYCASIKELEDTDQYRFVVGACDTTRCIKIFTNEKPELHQPHLCYKYFVKTAKSKNVYLIVDKKMPRTDMTTPPNQILEECERLINPVSPMRSLAQAIAVTDLSTIQGAITEDYEMKTVMVKGKDTTLKKFKVKDSTEEVTVTLWQAEKFDMDMIKVGETVKIKNVSPRKYGGSTELSSNRSTTVEHIETPVKLVTAKIMAYTADTLIVDDDDDIIEVFVDDADMPLEGSLKDYIRHETYISFKIINNKMISMEEVNFPDYADQAGWNDPLLEQL